VYSTVGDMIVKSHKQTSVAIYIVKSTVGDVIMKSYKQNSIAINFVDSNEEINNGHMQHSVLSSRKRVTAIISNKVDTSRYSRDEQVSRLSILQFMLVNSYTVH
jgi:hypothetical protein